MSGGENPGCPLPAGTNGFCSEASGRRGPLPSPRTLGRENTLCWLLAQCAQGDAGDVSHRRK